MNKRAKSRFLIGGLNKKIISSSQRIGLWASLVAQTVKHPPAMRKTWIRSLGREDSLEKGMTTQSSVLAWRIPRTEDTGEPQSMGSHRVRYNQATIFFNFVQWGNWRRKWQPTPVFLLGESHGRRSLVGYSPWSRKESDTTEQTSLTQKTYKNS